MTNLTRALRSVATVGAALLFFFGASIAYAQTAPQFKSVKVNGGVTGRCSVEIQYMRIANDSGNAAFQKINRANRMAVINKRAATTSDDIAIQDIAAEILEAYYEGMYQIPYHNVTQSARTVRGGKYVVFSTYIEAYYGGAHGMNTESSDAYNLSTGDRLDLSYLAAGAHGLTIRRVLYNRCRQQFGYNFLVSSFSEMPAPSSYELTDRGVTFIYFPYEVAPYAAGNVRIELTDAELRQLGVTVKW